ncbi:MAG: non-heme iron oxygenase ferredoxin subunit [Actinomycetota bacterium]
MSEISVGALLDLPTDAGYKVAHSSGTIAVFRLGDEAHAIADRCSHAEASLGDGDVFENEVECPKHGAAFDFTTGEALTLPATKPVTVYATEVRDGNVFIEIPDEESADERAAHE